MISKKVALLIMDGWGHGSKTKSNPIQVAKTPFVDSLYHKYSNVELVTSGNAVGLPEGQMGNSEVGHINLGAGRVVYQELQRIFNEIESGGLNNNKVLNDMIEYCIKENKPLHLLGLVSDGGVHSHYKHLIALLKICANKTIPKLCVHAFTDGRDTDPKSSLSYLEEVQKTLESNSQFLSSIIGRYYAMDRDNRWERIAVAYNALTKGVGNRVSNVNDAICSSYVAGVTDEFLKPIILRAEDTIQPKDAVLFFNFRTDRCREIVRALCMDNFTDYDMKPLPLKVATMTEYDKTFNKHVSVLFNNENINNTLGQTLQANSKTQLRIAETEKYPHVTFFFNGGRENPFEGEQRILVASPKVATYDLQPEMSAYEVAEKSCQCVNDSTPDFVCLNFANPDMVGHTGVWDAVIKAIETTDKCVSKVVETLLDNRYSILLTADHGNAEYIINEDGTPNTAHTTNAVPLFLIDNGGDFRLMKNGKLGDIAPTILQMMDIPKPREMTGDILV